MATQAHQPPTVLPQGVDRGGDVIAKSDGNAVMRRQSCRT